MKARILAESNGIRVFASLSAWRAFVSRRECFDALNSYFFQVDFPGFLYAFAV
jgi:hypothetical protein